MTLPSASMHFTPSPPPSPSSSSSPSSPLSSSSPEKPTSTHTSPNPLSTARSLVLLQLLSRLLTFTLNQTLLRSASPAVFGTAAIQFDLVCSTILFLSREGIRNALLRRRDSPSADTAHGPSTATELSERKQLGERQIRALSVVPLQLGTCISIVITTIYLLSSDETTTSQPTFHLSLLLYVVSALLELSIEPIYIRVHRSSPPKLSVRVQAEGGMAIIKAVVTVGALLSLGEGGALLGFALGQIAGAGWLASRYLRETGWDVRSLIWTGRVRGETRFDASTLSLAVANTGQSVIKHLLTEADRLAVARISPLEDQGGYAVAMNYGSLIARIIFQPLEESLLLHFSTSLSSPSTLPLLSLVLRLSTTLTLLIRTFVNPLYPAISALLLPRQYQSTTAPDVLRLYLTTYIPVLSLNGLLEAFHTASATPAQVKTQARWMIASSAVFAASLGTLTKLPPFHFRSNIGFDISLSNPSREGALVLASSLAMLARIIYALKHARRHFVSSGGKTALNLWSVVPATHVILWSWPVWLGLTQLQKTERWTTGLKGWVELIGTGGVLGLITLAILYKSEKRSLAKLRDSMRVEKTE